MGRLGVFECDGLKSDKAEWAGKSHQFASHQNDGGWLGHILLVRVGSDGRVRGELELADGGNISGGGEQLEGGLLLRVSNVDGDLAGTKVLQGRSRIVGVFNPLNSLGLTGLPRGGGGGGGGLYFSCVSALAVCERKRGKPT